MTDYSVPSSLVEEPFWPEMLLNVKSTWKSDRLLIKKYCIEKNIQWLCHFTTATNLRSLFDNGINSRSLLAQEALSHQRIDNSSKLYFENFNYLSISIPNTKMLHSKFNQGSWVAVVVLDASLLWQLPFFSIPMNSAKWQMRQLMSLNYAKFLGLSGLRALFGNLDIREKCNVPISEPTDVQSEVIFLDTIPSHYFRHVLLTPKDKTSLDFLSVANEFGFFKSGTNAKYEWKWLTVEQINAWGPKYSPSAQECYNLRKWNEDWGKNG